MDLNKLLIEKIRVLKPSKYMNPKIANKLYSALPSPSDRFLAIKSLMEKTTSDTSEIKITAYEPVYGVIKSVKAGTTVPLIEKLGFKSEKLFTADFGESVNFTHDEIKAQIIAEKSSSSDAEVRAVADSFLRAMTQLKYRNDLMPEKYFWQGCLGAMNIIQDNNGVITNNVIDTNVQSMTALATTYKWDADSATSTADPVKDLMALNGNFKGTGARLSSVFMNQKTFDTLMLVPKVRDKWVEASNLEIEKDGITGRLGGKNITVYDECYLDDNKALTNFIPDGYLIGIAQGVGVNEKPVKYVECLNVEATEDKALQGKAVYGTYLYISGTHNPVSKMITLTNCALPVFENPLMIIYQKVF